MVVTAVCKTVAFGHCRFKSYLSQFFLVAMVSWRRKFFLTCPWRMLDSKGRLTMKMSKDNSDRDDRIGMVGLVMESNTGLFRVKIDGTENVVTCLPAGKIRQHKINIVVGDRVRVEMSPYDLTRGRIMFRL